MAQKGNKHSLKHGVYAKEILLPNESAQEFEQHLQEFQLQFNPFGGPQEAVVRELAAIQWVKDRLNGALRQSFLHSELIQSEIGKSPQDLIVDCLKLSNEFLTSAREMALLLADKTSQAKLALLKGATPEERQKVLNAAHQLAKSSNEWITILQATVNRASQLASVVRDPLTQNVDVVLKLFEQLDRRYDKGVQRLVNMKEYGRLYGIKRIEELPKADPTPIAPNNIAGDPTKSKTLNGRNVDE